MVLRLDDHITVNATDATGTKRHFAIDFSQDRAEGLWQVLLLGNTHVD